MRLQFNLRTLLALTTVACLYIGSYFALLAPQECESGYALKTDVLVVQRYRELRYRGPDPWLRVAFAPLHQIDLRLRADYWMESPELIHYQRNRVRPADLEPAGGIL